MSRLCDDADCTGCMACYSACKFDAIEIIEDELGMLRPIISDNICKHCGICTKVCPVLHVVPGTLSISAWALKTMNELDRDKCASGGVSTTLARYVIMNGGNVFGTGFDVKGVPIFKQASNLSEIEEFRGSKYVYCFPGKIYRDVEEALKIGELCLFVGTPCQTDGLKHYLKKDYEKLILVDLICHGTPPNTYLESHIGNLNIPHDQISRIEFRGERDYYLSVIATNNTNIYCKKSDEDSYFLAFLSGLIHREICYQCPYACEKRISDITIGDFWGLPQNALDAYLGRVSVALINTEKGDHYLQQILPMFHAEKRTVYEALSGNDQLNRPSNKSSDRNAFCINYVTTKSFQRAIDKTSIAKRVRKNILINRAMYVPRIIKRKIIQRI